MGRGTDADGGGGRSDEGEGNGDYRAEGRGMGPLGDDELPHHDTASLTKGALHVAIASAEWCNLVRPKSGSDSRDGGTE